MPSITTFITLSLLLFSDTLKKPLTSYVFMYLKNIWTFVKVNHGKKEFIRVMLWITIGIGNHLVFFMCLFANRTLPCGRQSCKHYHDWVVSGSISNIVSKFVSIKPYNLKEKYTYILIQVKMAKSEKRFLSSFIVFYVSMLQFSDFSNK